MAVITTPNFSQPAVTRIETAPQSQIRKRRPDSFFHQPTEHAEAIVQLLAANKALRQKEPDAVSGQIPAMPRIYIWLWVLKNETGQQIRRRTGPLILLLQLQLI